MSTRVGALKLKSQLFCGDERAMGPGKADLLDAIAVHGSISAAGRALGMSYRYTWLMVDSMTRCFCQPLVETTAGGGTTRGTVLTDFGRDVLAAYRALEADLTDLARAHPRLAELQAMMRDAPLPKAGPRDAE